MSSMFYFLAGPFGALMMLINGEKVVFGFIVANLVFWLTSSMGLAFLLYKWDRKPERQKVIETLIFATMFFIFAGLARLV